jgi:UDP-2,3-diacylglucosamine pyrophosphatase LpxH
VGKLFVKGDIHGDLRPIIDFIQKNKLGKDDCILILGDCGIAWRDDKIDLNFNIDLYEKSCNEVQLYFIRGNHENYDILKEYEKVNHNSIHISEHIIYLPDGEYLLNGEKVLVCGGADSIDRAFRVEGLSWWADEIVSKDFIDSILGADYNYIFTHCCPISVFNKYQTSLCTLKGLDQDKIEHKSEEILEELFKKVTFKHHYFGHYHVDKQLDDKHTCVFNGFIELK